VSWPSAVGRVWERALPERRSVCSWVSSARAAGSDPRRRLPVKSRVCRRDVTSYHEEAVGVRVNEVVGGT